MLPHTAKHFSPTESTNRKNPNSLF